MKKFFLLILVCLSFSLATNVHAFPIAGSSSGTFQNPVGPSGMVVTGTGTSSFTWGTGDPSSLQFTGTSFSNSTDTVFSFGTLTYYNGEITAGTQADSVELNVDLSFTDPAGIVQNFVYNLALINTVNTSDPEASADYVNFPSSIPDNFFNYNGTEYTLEFMGFGTPGSGGFTNISGFHVYEMSTASAQLLGRVTVNPTSVPEPTTMLLLGTALLGLAGLGMKKFKKS